MADASASTGSDAHRVKRQKVADPFIPNSPPSEATVDEINRKINADHVVRVFRAAYRFDLDKRCFPTLLSIIATHAGEQLDPRFCGLDVCRSLLEKKNELGEKLQAAWGSESFSNILELDYLHPRFPVQVGLSENRLQWQNKEQNIRAAWEVPYEGGHHLLLLENIKRMKTPLPYSNICAVVQSSGTGKSRMVDELAKLVYTFPVNIRSRPMSKEGPFVAHPPSDDSLHSYLTRKTGTADECRMHYMAFFWSLFRHAANEIKTWFGQEPRESQELFASRWREHMNNQVYRQGFYEEVVKLCTSAPMDEEGTFVMKELEHLINVLDERCESTNPDIKVIVYIDEAHELNHVLSATTEKLLSILCSVLAGFSNRPLFCLLLSTQSSLQALAPPIRAATSERAILNAQNLPAPITETPFDCAPDIKVFPGVLYLEDLIKLDYLSKWGRSLWWSMVKTGGPGRGQPPEDRLQLLISIAQMKLLGWHDLRMPLWQVPVLAQTAVLDVPLALDFEPRRETSHEALDKIAANEANMVAGHMRIAYSVPHHREYLRSGYPSEPLLAEAAAQQIHLFQSGAKAGSNVMANILNNILGSTLVDVGQRGEVVMRLLLMQAYMDGVVAERGPSALIFSRGCSIITFIQQLFTKEPAEEILKSQPNNIKLDTTFRAQFRNAVVRFTHFVKAGDEIVLTTEALFAAFARGMAFIGHQQQQCVDIIIPVLLNRSNVLQESAMSAILIQVKRRLKTRSGTAYAFSQGSVGLFPGDDDRPYFILIAELGGQEPQNTDDKEQQKQDRKGKGKVKEPTEILKISPQPVVLHHPRDTHPRFLTTVYGCSGTLYKAVGNNYQLFQQLLATPNFLDEHPHKDSGSRCAVMRFKPVWQQGEDSFHWVESKMLNE